MDLERRPEECHPVARMRTPPEYKWIHGLLLIPNNHDYAPKGDPRYERVAKQIQASNPNAMLGYYWHKNCIVYDGKSLKSYWNGILLSEQELAYQLEHIGKLFLGSDGKIAFHKLEVFSAALDSAQVAELSKGGNVAEKDRVVSVKVPDDAEVGQYVSFLENKGSAGGRFLAAEDPDHAPDVKTVDGQKAVYFNGESAFLQSSSFTPDDLVGAEPFTIDIWAYLEDNSTGDQVFALASDVVVTPGIAGGRPVPKSKWCRLTMVSEGGIDSSVRAYVNGERVDSADRSGRVPLVRPGKKMTIGGDPPHGRNTGYFKGAIKRIRVYDYARSEKAIAGEQ